MLWNHPNNTSQTYFDLRFNWSTIYLNIWDGAWNPFTSGWINVVQPSPWQRHHYTTVINSSTNKAYLYIDWEYAWEALYRNPTNTSTSRIFSVWWVSSYKWNGLIDELRIYNRALSASEVETIYTTNIARYNFNKRKLSKNLSWLIEWPRPFRFVVNNQTDFTTSWSRSIVKWTYITSTGEATVVQNTIPSDTPLNTQYKKIRAYGTGATWEVLLASGIQQIIPEGDSWDGVLQAPTLIPQWATWAATTWSDWISPFSTIYKTIEAWSKDTNLIASGWLFKLKVKVDDPTLEQWSEVVIYRSSDDGQTRTLNEPQHICILDQDLMCEVDTDHLSFFSYLGSFSTFYINSNDTYTNTEDVGLNINIPKANYIRFSTNSGLSRGSWYGPYYMSNLSIPYTLTGVTSGTVATRTVRAQFKSWSTNTWTDFDTIIVDKQMPAFGDPVITSWLTWDNWKWDLFYRWTVDVWVTVTDTALKTATCKLSFNGWLNYPYIASYAWTSSAWYCYRNSNNPMTNITLKFYINDEAGNTWYSKSTTYTYDVTAPTTSINPNWISCSSSTTASLSCDDWSGVGCNRSEYKLIDVTLWDEDCDVLWLSTYSAPFAINWSNWLYKNYKVCYI